MATQAQLDAIAAAYVSGNNALAAQLIASNNVSAGTLRAAFNLNDADVTYLQNQGIVGGNLAAASAPAPAPAPAAYVPPPGGQNPTPAPAPAPVPAGPAYAGISGLLAPQTLAQTGGSFTLPNGQLAFPVYGNGGYDASAGDYVAGPVTEFRVYNNLGPGDSTRYANTPYTRVDPAGNVIGTGTFASDLGKDSWVDKVGQIGLAIGAALVTGNALGLIAAPGGSAAAAGTAGSAGTAGPTLSKAALDGTNVFGANSVAGAYQIGGTAVKAVGAALGVAGAAGAGTTNATGRTTPPVYLPPRTPAPATTTNNTWLAVAAAAAIGLLAWKG